MEQETETINRRPLVIGEFIWDMFPHQLDSTAYRNIQNSLGLLPSDDDGLDILHKMADLRKLKIQPIQPKLEEMSVWAAEVVVEYAFRSAQARGAELSELPGEIRLMFNTQNKEVLEMGVTAIVAHLVDTGVLALTDKAIK
jgi:hypothetical protein